MSHPNASLLIVGLSIGIPLLMCGGCGVPALFAPKSEPSASATASAPVTYSSGLESYVTSGGEERCRLAFRVYERRDTNTPPIAGHNQSLIVDGVPSEFDLRQLLTTYHAEQRASVEASRAPKKVAVFVYPTERRAKIGASEWNGRAIADGEHLPEKPELTLHLPDADAEVPTEREEEIYDALALELNEHPDDSEKTVTARIAKRFDAERREHGAFEGFGVSRGDVEVLGAG